MIKRNNEFAAILLGVFVGIIFWVTVIGRDTIHDNIFRFQPFHTFSNIVTEIQIGGIKGNLLGNILLFFPTGVLYPVAFYDKWKNILVFGGSLSVIIEVSQIVFQKGYFEVDDIICNVLGTIIGFLVFRGLRGLL